MEARTQIPDLLAPLDLTHGCVGPDDSCVWYELAQLSTPLVRASALDHAGLVLLYTARSASFVFKLGTASALAREAEKSRIGGRLLADEASVRAVTMCLVRTAGCELGVSRYLGPDLTRARRRVSLEHVASILDVLDSLRIDHSGFVPRNCIWGKGDTMLLVDWEDARFGSTSSRLSSVKVTNAWSEYFGGDVSTRLSRPVAMGGAHELDEWDRTLLELHDVLPPNVEKLVEAGVQATFESERWSRSAPRAASIGHCIDDAVGSRLSVYYTLVCAFVRVRSPERFVEWVDRHSEDVLERDSDACRQAIADLTMIAIGLLGLTHPQAGVSATPWLADFPALDAASRRAAAVEPEVDRLWVLLRQLLGLGSVELLLRGSLSQGLMTTRSDVDFEISASEFPDGHRPLESLFVELLGLLGHESEGSAGRPDTYDIGIVANRTCRDAFELLELRRIGAPERSAGWMDAVVDLDAVVDHVVSTATTYEASRECPVSDGKWDWVASRMSIYRDYLRGGWRRGRLVTHTLLQLDAFPPRERLVRASQLEEALLKRERM